MKWVITKDYGVKSIYLSMFGWVDGFGMKTTWIYDYNVAHVFSYYEDAINAVDDIVHAQRHLNGRLIVLDRDVLNQSGTPVAGKDTTTDPIADFDRAMKGLF